jgi:hypothetical protein
MTQQSRKLYDFSSVGQTTSKFKSEFDNPVADFPIGILTPLRLGYENDGIFKMSKDLITQVRDNFKNMLATNWGDRLMLYDFGANLSELSFEMGNESGDMEAIVRIKNSIDKYMPFIIPQTFETFSEASQTPSEGVGKVGIRITYSISNLSSENFVDEVIIYSAG